MYSGTLLIRTLTEHAIVSLLNVSILSGLIVEKIYELFFVGIKETVRYIQVSILSGCQ